MKVEEIMILLKEVAGEAERKYKARIKGIFGSFVRSEEHEKSDLDVLVEFESDADLIHFVGLSLFLEEKIGLKVDVVPYDAIRAEIKKNILREAIYL
ncbi:MAG: nucleotidyltransferase family protein [Deltaproteobacteria bacterium]|nr:nucleotidyltransferase family protein [Deltaproteobacteria bacterium]